MADEQSQQLHNHVGSGSTSPNESPTPSLRRSESMETMLSSDATTEVESNPSIVYPGPPVNSPTTQSLAGDLGAVNLDQADEQLLAAGPTQPNSVVDTSEGKAHLRSRVRSDVPLLKQLFKRPPKSAKRVAKVTKKAHVGATDDPKPTEAEYTHEHSAWVTVAQEDLVKGLQRLTQAAKDLHKIDESKSVEQYYCEKLAEVLKNAEIEFDPKYLQ